MTKKERKKDNWKMEGLNKGIGLVEFPLGL